MDPTPLTPDPALIPPTAKQSEPGTVITAQVLMWLHFAAAPCILGGFAMAMLFRMSDVESGPIRGAEAAAMLIISLGALLITAEGTIAACLCTPTAKAWFTRDLTEPINPLVAAGAESRD
jgi:hypothetical protein